MVVKFNCPKCKGFLKIHTVKTHKCKPTSVKCYRCAKIFKGDEYVAHTSCSNQTKKDGVQDRSAILKKQALWLDHVVTSGPKAKDPSVKALLARVSNFPNIPRNRPKFHNFMKSCTPPAKYDEKLVNVTFDFLESEIKKPTPSKKPPTAAGTAPTKKKSEALTKKAADKKNLKVTEKTKKKPKEETPAAPKKAEPKKKAAPAKETVEKKTTAKTEKPVAKGKENVKATAKATVKTTAKPTAKTTAKPAAKPKETPKPKEPVKSKEKVQKPKAPAEPQQTGAAATKPKKPKKPKVKPAAGEGK